MAVRGGKRPGSGRPKKEATTTVAFRVRVAYVEHIKKVVKQAIADLEKKSSGKLPTSETE